MASCSCKCKRLLQTIKLLRGILRLSLRQRFKSGCIQRVQQVPEARSGDKTHWQIKSWGRLRLFQVNPADATRSTPLRWQTARLLRQQRILLPGLWTWTGRHPVSVYERLLKHTLGSALQSHDLEACPRNWVFARVRHLDRQADHWHNPNDGQIRPSNTQNI